MSCLASIITKKLKLDLDSDTFNIVYRAYLQHLTKDIDAWDFGKVVKPFVPKGLSAKVFRLELLEDKYNYFTLKLFIFELSKIKLGDNEKIVKLADSLSIHDLDLDRIVHIWNSTLSFRISIKKLVKALPKNTLSISTLEKEFEEIYPRVKKHIKSTVYKKLRFVVSSTNSTFEDFESELLIKALQTYYKLVPTLEDREYIINYLNRALTNEALNIIGYHTSDKRARLVCTGRDNNNERQFSLRTVSDNQSTQLEDSILFEEKEFCSIGDNFTGDDFQINALVSSMDKRSKKYRICFILMGSYDEEFTEWLVARKHCKQGVDNTEFQEKVAPAKFRALLSKFLYIDDDELNILLFEFKSFSNVETCITAPVKAVSKAASKAVSKAVSKRINVRRLRKV